MFKIIACINRKNVIGNGGKLIYTIGNDLANFASMTKFNGVVVMGRKTYESLPGHKPLKDRINVIITSNENYGVNPDYDNVYIVHSIRDAVELCATVFYDKELFVIGGESIYQQFMDLNLVDEMLLTIVNDDEDGDAKFPEFDENGWYCYYKSMAQTSSFNGVEKSFYFKIFKNRNKLSDTFNFG